MDLLITVETDLFEHKEVKPNFINRCCFGEDFAAWLSRQISPLARSNFNISEPIQEDYGWGFWVWHSNDSFWVAISYLGDGPQEPAQWVISVNPDSGLNLLKRIFHKPDQQALKHLRDCIREAITANASIRIVTGP
jgi:hypothetical protein